MNNSLNFCNNLLTFPDSPILKCQKVVDTTTLLEGKDSESNRELQVNKTRYEAEVCHVDTKVAKVSNIAGESRGTGASEATTPEATASEVTSPTDKTTVVQMIRDDLKEGEGVIGEQNNQMDTLMGTMEMTLTRVIIIISAVLYE